MIDLKEIARYQRYLDDDSATEYVPPTTPEQIAESRRELIAALDAVTVPSQPAPVPLRPCCIVAEPCDCGECSYCSDRCLCNQEDE